eukprot:scaffold920_cov135-Isochrysis_galbana.AAC.7
MAGPAQAIHNEYVAARARAPPRLPGSAPTSCCLVLAADLIKQKGDQQLTVEQLTQEITPHGRGARQHPAPSHAH